MLREPLLHGTNDKLPKDSPLLFVAGAIYCKRCCEILHASYNENMQFWVESGKGNFCLPCFSITVERSIEHEDFALRD